MGALIEQCRASNLAKIGQLKAEPASALDIERLLAMARKHLDDAKRESTSIEGRFISAYSVGACGGLGGAALARSPQ